jgi:hypothetical protein
VNHAVKVSSRDYPFERSTITNINVVDAVAWVVEMFADVVVLDGRIIEIVEIVNDCDTRDVACE